MGTVKRGSCQLLAKVRARSTGGLSLLRKSVVRLNDCPDMTLDVYRDCDIGSPLVKAHHLVLSFVHGTGQIRAIDTRDVTIPNV